MRYHPRTRLVFLGVVNVVILLHIFAYYVLDRREIGCVDFFGLATFVGKGQITAGTVFLAALVVVTLLLGRVFCGWGCHFALFQDLLVKLLQRMGVRTTFRRSRLEFIVPPLLLFVTLLYPILAWWREAGVPTVISANISYPEVWHLLPGVKGVVLILVVDVVVLTLLFGSRAFCRYICPYGLFLKPLHALSPLRVAKVGDCSGCGSCARSCPTGVPIKYEVETFGVVHDLNCMNCGDCVAACPTGALSLRPTRRAYALSFKRIVTQSSHPRWVDATLLVSAVLGLFLFRGREFGDFLAVGLGLATGATIVIALRPQQFIRARRSLARPSLRTLRYGAIVAAAFLTLGLVGQAVGLYALRHGHGALENRDYVRLERTYAATVPAIRALRPATFYLDDFEDHVDTIADDVHREGDRLLVEGALSDAAHAYRSVLKLRPDRIAAHGNLGTALLKDGDYFGAVRCYLRVLEADPNDLIALYHLAMAHIQLKQHDDAILLVRRILDIDTVGNAYDLMKENPLFQLLESYPEYRRSMAAYALVQPPGATNVKKGETP